MSKIVGYRYVKYTSKKDGKPREGYEIHLENSFPDYQAKESCGLAVETAWCNVDTFIGADVKLGDEVDMFYDKRGRLIRILPQ